MNTVYTNGRVSICKDIIFGLSVLSETGWIPIEQLIMSEYELVKKLIDNDPVFPWKDEFSSIKDRIPLDAEHLTNVLQEKRTLQAVVEMCQKPSRKFTPLEKAEAYLVSRARDYRRMLEMTYVEDQVTQFFTLSDKGTFVYAQLLRNSDNTFKIARITDNRIISDDVSELEAHAMLLKMFW